MVYVLKRRVLAEATGRWRMAGNPPSRHLWVGGLPEEIGEAEIKELFTKWVVRNILNCVLYSRPNTLTAVLTSQVRQGGRRENLAPTLS